MRTTTVILVLCGLLTTSLTAQETVNKATMLYSAAPWDAGAYELDLSLPPTREAPSPTIRIQIWSRPEYLTSHTLQFVKGDHAQAATWQSELNHSMPHPLTGQVTFDRLTTGQSVTGTFDLVAADGRRFTGSFTAPWGNTPFPIR